VARNHFSGMHKPMAANGEPLMMVRREKEVIAALPVFGRQSMALRSYEWQWRVGQPSAPDFVVWLPVAASFPCPEMVQHYQRIIMFTTRPNLSLDI